MKSVAVQYGCGQHLSQSYEDGTMRKQLNRVGYLHLVGYHLRKGDSLEKARR